LGAAAGLVLIGVARWLDHSSWHLYSVYDYWHTSPDFFLTRVGLLLLILFLAFAWCRWGLGSWGFSALMQMGQTSLLVYWVHIEFVYGRFSILQKKSQNIGSATFGLLVIFLSMLALSVVRTKFKRARLRFTLPSQERTQATRAT
jgi:fucose 4-O-acetylase-like acetyltransferase